jgi:hypothetical protein
MQLTTQQVAEKLKIGSTQVKTLVKHGKLTPSNKKKPEATKFFMKFDSKDIAEYLKNNNTNGHRSRPIISASKDEDSKPTGIVTRLDRIESKIDKLLKLWS